MGVGPRKGLCGSRTHLQRAAPIARWVSHCPELGPATCTLQSPKLIPQVAGLWGGSVLVSLSKDGTTRAN